LPDAPTSCGRSEPILEIARSPVIPARKLKEALASGVKFPLNGEDWTDYFDRVEKA